MGHFARDYEVKRDPSLLMTQIIHKLFIVTLHSVKYAVVYGLFVLPAKLKINHLMFLFC